MSWHSTLDTLQAILQELFDDKQRSRVVVDKAGITSYSVGFSDTSSTNWHAILSEAHKQKKVAALVTAALQAYPEQAALKDAGDAYTRAMSQAASRAHAGASQPADKQFSATVDLAIVTALTEELTPVLNLIGGRDQWETKPVDGFLHHFGQFTCGAITFNVVASALDKVGGISAAGEVLLLKQFKPRLIMMTGICAGRQEKDIALGDVIVAERAYHMGEGKQVGTSFVHDIRTFSTKPWLVNWLKSFEHHREWHTAMTTPRPHSMRYQADWLLCQLKTQGEAFPATQDNWEKIKAEGIAYARAKQVLQDKKLINVKGKLSAAGRQYLQAISDEHYGQFIPTPDADAPRVHYLAFASSQAVIAAENPFGPVADVVRTTGAIDMEVAALYDAAERIDVPVFAVKGVSDYATLEKDDAFHAYAAEASARWMYAFICANANALDDMLPGRHSPPTQQGTAQQNTAPTQKPVDLESALLDDDPQYATLLTQLKAEQGQLAHYQLERARGDSSYPTALKIKELPTVISQLQGQIIDLQAAHLERIKQITRPSAAVHAKAVSLNKEVLELKIAVAQAELRVLEDSLRIQPSARGREDVGARLDAKKREVKAFQQQLVALV